MGTVKGFKVTDAERKLRVGIAVKNMDDLKRKTLDKFKLKLPASQLFFQTPDGTVIETNEYLQTLQPQTLLIWTKQGERADTDAEILYKTIREVNEEYLTAGERVQEFFSEKMKSKVYKLAEVLKGIDDEKVKLSLREDHPEWFEGLDTRAKTKEEYMFRRAQDRIRTYYYKTREELLKESPPSPKLQLLLKQLQEMLKTVRFFGCYFDRSFAPQSPEKSKNSNEIQDLEGTQNQNCFPPSAEPLRIEEEIENGTVLDLRHSLDSKGNAKDLKISSKGNSSKRNPKKLGSPQKGTKGSPEKRLPNQEKQLPNQERQDQVRSLCKVDGTFHCQGRWDKEKCLYNMGHGINPYKSREDRIVFQTWNLDHRKERSRSIIPAILEALGKDGKNGLRGEVDVASIFDDLFTLNNLKFVHIVCHDKGAHDVKAGPYLT